MMKCSNNLYNANNFHIRQVYLGIIRDEPKPIHPLQQEVLICGNKVDKKQTFSGKRIERGLYRSKKGIIINAGINGLANILRKQWHKPVSISHKRFQQYD